MVEQIELLTSDIDLTGDEANAGLHSDTLGSSSSSGVMVGGSRAEGEDSGDVESGRADSAPSSQKSNVSESSSPVLSNTVVDNKTRQTVNSNEDYISASPNYPLNSNSPPANQSSDPKPKGRKEGMKPAILRAVTLGARGKKPPPYPHQHPKNTRPEKGRDCPPYPVKRRLLSTTV